MDSPSKENLKKAFSKVKKDINFLNNEILELKIIINELKTSIDNHQTTSISDSTVQQINKADFANPTHNPTVRQELKGFKPINLAVSIGNEGVPTDKQTNRQTDNPTHYLDKNHQKSIEKNIQEVSEILESLDSLKKEIRLKFKHLTSQEMSVFSTIYQLEEQGGEVTYNRVSNQLKLSESSIRDYTQRIINKGIPIKKHKVNNKKIILSVSQELKKIVSLSTIIRLREL